MSNKNIAATKSHLKILMMHIMKWYTEPLMRSVSWIRSINNARNEIEKLRRKQPSITDDVIKELWDDIQKKARKEAEKEMKQKATKTTLTFDEVFKHPYILTVLVLVALGFIYLNI